MASNYAGLGTTLAIKISSTFTTIANVVSIEGPDPVLGLRDTTKLSSVYHEKRPTLPDLGKVKLTLQYDPDDTTHALLLSKILSPPAAPDEFKLTYPDGKTTPANEDFKGFVVSRKLKGITPKGTIEADVEIDLTDLFTQTAGV